MTSKKHKRTHGQRALIVWGGSAVVVAIAAAVIWFGFGGSGESATRAPVRQAPVVSTEKLVTVDVVDKDYIPRTLTVSKGATITWKFIGDLPHDVVDDRGAFKSDIQAEGEYTRTFDTPGSFYYYCTLHHGMQGTLTVIE